jgi:hypothetical protein
MHVPRAATLHRDEHGVIEMSLDPGIGTSPDVRARLVPIPEPALGHPWSLCFATWRDFLAYCVPQERAMTVEPSSGRVMRQEIELNIELDKCLPFSGEVESEAVRGIAGDLLPLCFVVEQVKFRFAGQECDR